MSEGLSKSSPIRTIFFDESGFTGFDLLNPEQPIFVEASVALNVSEADQLKAKHFSAVNAQELKYSSLKRYPRNLKAIQLFLEELTEQSVVKVAVADKRYALTAKMVDLILEPVMHEDGFDLYQDGSAQAIASMLHYVLTSHGLEGFGERLLRVFQSFVRGPSPTTMSAFLQVLFEDSGELASGALEPIRLAVRKLNRRLLPLMKLGSLDLTLTMPLALVSMWRNEGSENFEIIHDASSAMAEQKDAWNSITSPDQLPGSYRHNRHTMSFPLRVLSTAWKSSEDYAGLQLADIVAGAALHGARWYRNGQSAADEFGEIFWLWLISLPHESNFFISPIDPAATSDRGGHISALINDAERWKAE